MNVKCFYYSKFSFNSRKKKDRISSLFGFSNGKIIITLKNVMRTQPHQKQQFFTEV